MSRGFVIFAHNNGLIDYATMALCATLLVKWHLHENAVSLITDDDTYRQMKVQHGDRTTLFDEVVICPRPPESSQRRFRDGAEDGLAPWHNASRCAAFKLSPWEQTILLDSDFLVQDDSFDRVWDLPDDYLVNQLLRPLDHKEPHWSDRYVNDHGIALYWATALYFRKGPASATLFGLLADIKERYHLYQSVYEVPPGPYRNDYALSIALHMLHGGAPVGSLPTPHLLTAFERDELVEVRRGEAVFVGRERNSRRPLISRVGVNVHCMNKFSLLRHAGRLIELYA